ncbi:hypothetical protein H8B13_02765 [Hymenobacter sp. BT188]|uniref:hypothetical protein n=1 Tax=Hymenobacter sp. BT188 TaxID=2763504 RepID=UPI0016512CEB|nr:hypothetical protein [Hymenobacter sp. BT188]MBC6605731.1 hypothetical protein [Hymenobacter sp. BT188]
MKQRRILSYLGTALLLLEQQVDDSVLTGELERSIFWTRSPSATQFFRQLFRACPALRGGAVQSFNQSTDAVVVEHTAGSERVAIVMNVRKRSVRIHLPDSWSGGKIY